MNDYIKDSFSGFSFGYDYYQVFANKWMVNLLTEEIIKMRNSNLITDEDLKIVKFIYDFKFATSAIITNYLKNNETVEVVKAKLDKLVKNRILNKFMMSRIRDEKFKPDALTIYCLDLGGKTLLSHYGTPNNGIESWYTSTVMMSSEMISHYLAVANFYTRVADSVGDRLEYFKSAPLYRIGKNVVIPSFEMCINSDNGKKYFVGEIARDYDFPVAFREKAIKIESILCTKAWMKYFYEHSDVPPTLLIIAEDDEAAVNAGDIITHATGIEAFRLSTDERILHPLGEIGSFLKYDKENNAIIGVKSSIFAGK